MFLRCCIHLQNPQLKPDQVYYHIDIINWSITAHIYMYTYYPDDILVVQLHHNFSFMQNFRLEQNKEKKSSFSTKIIYNNA